MNLIFGILSSILIWIFSIYTSFYLKIPTINISDIFWWILFSYFVTDFFITIIWSLIHLPPHKQGKKLIMSGPYNWTRHPVYSSVIWSGTGIITLIWNSWVVMFSVIPVSLIWSWIAMNEEIALYKIFGEKYKKYSTKTGVFYPKLDK